MSDNQKWIYNGVEFKVGDKVQVVRKATYEETNWKSRWVVAMDKYIGSTFVIEELGESAAWLRAVLHCAGYWFPLSSLKNLSAEEILNNEKEFKVGDLAEVVDASGGAEGDYSVGEIVRVKAVEDSVADDFTLLFCEGKDAGMYSSRFKKVDPLPDSFQFHVNNGLSTIYTATKTTEGYNVTWETYGGGSKVYDLKTMVEFTRKGTWKIVEQPAKETPLVCNGFDSEGNPKNFTEDDLKPMMRFVTADGEEWIVVENVQNDYDCSDKFIGAGDGWTDFVVDDKSEYAPIVVYAAPKLNRDLLDVSVKGPLIWQKNAPVKEAPVVEDTFKTRLAYFEASIAAVEEAAKENVKSLREELAKLKEGFSLREGV